MFKRRTSSRSTNYTGVNHTALPGQEPSNNARAAALTIGQAISNPSGPATSYSNVPSHSSRNQSRLLSVSRLQLINGFNHHSTPANHQNTTTSPIPVDSRQSSLLKRSKLITTKPNQGGLFQNFELLGPASRRRSVSSLSIPSQSVPRSDLINHRQVADLLLSNPTSAASLPTTAHPVKMVKKYVPTPNGIQIIEVPETVIQQEMARTNSMRGSSSRTSSLRRQDPQRRTLLLRNTKPPSSARQQRLLLLVEAPVELELMKIPTLQRSTIPAKATTSNKSAIKPVKSLASLSQTLPIEEEVRRLDEEIERELHQVEELQKRRLQWENLQKQRQSEEAKIRQLQASEEREYPVPQFQVQDINEPEVPKVPVVPTVSVAQDQAELSTVEPRLDDVVDLPNVSTNLSIILSNYSEDAPQLDSTNGNILNHAEPTPADVSFDQWVQEQNNSTLDGTEKELLANQLRPKFDNTTTTIPDELNLKIPKVSEDKHVSSASLIQLASTLDLPLKKPMKSAMKKPSKIILQSNQASNPAHQAYLQLTTAENTRMNLKLLLSALEDVRHKYLESQLQGAIQPPPVQATTPVKRLSLRQSSPAQQQQAKSLRPQSMVAPENQKTAMSLRLLRNLYVAPIAPHPALQPGYKLPAKAKAADLYAKANSRPRSTFKANPETKKILTLRQSNGVTTQNGKAPPKHITAQVADIRDHASQPQENNSSPNKYVSDSRIVDSEDEEPQRKGFTSRFNDSDDEDVFDRRIVSSNSTVSSPPNPHIISLREDKKPEKQQKKKFGKLRKLFGK